MMHLSEVAAATQGRVIGADVVFTRVGTDSRTVQSGDLFVALRGEHFDGHAYASECIKMGAAAVMLDQQAAMEGVGPAVLVPDTRLGLGQLASHWRDKFNIPFAAITGSNGKTTVKEMLASILRIAAGQEERVLSTQGNLNNDIGLPLTLLRLRAEHRFAVVEMGMNHEGEISYLTRLGKPTVALVNNATLAHLGGLGSVEAIARAKGEIFEGLAENGTAIINADDVFADFWRGLAAQRQILTFGLKNKADVNAKYKLGTDSSELLLQTPQGEKHVLLPAAGLHNVSNALASTAAALAMNVSLADIAQGLAAFGGVKGRLQHKPGFNHALVIDDTYNANPASMKAAIDVLAARSGTRLLVLGDMGELGADEGQLHTEIGNYARHSGIDGLYTLGTLSREMTNAFGSNAQHHESPEALADELKRHMNNSTTVLVKGSRFMRMERVVNLIGEETREGSNNAA